MILHQVCALHAGIPGSQSASWRIGKRGRLSTGNEEPLGTPRMEKIWTAHKARKIQKGSVLFSLSEF
jgi:hypothetical protein